MAAFATHQDLAARLNVTLTADEQSRATSLLELASGVVQDAARQRIELVEDDVLVLRGAGQGSILLPERPVRGVASVKVGTRALVAGAWHVEHDDTLVAIAGLGTARDELTVTYTHGYAPDEIPAIVKALTLELAVRVWSNPMSVAGQRLGSTQVTYAIQGAPAGMTLTATERSALRRALRRGARSDVAR